jgi:hypothetical protein
MAMNFHELEQALYHIRVNYFFCADPSKLRIQLSHIGNGDTIIDVWDKDNKHIGNFSLAFVTEEIALLQQNKIGFTDLDANNAEEIEEN